MTLKNLRNLLCTAAAALFGGYGTAAQATLYDLSYDPPFAAPGSMLIDVPLGSPCRNGGVQPCNFTVFSVDLFDSGGNEWGISAPLTPLGSQVDFATGGVTLLHIQMPSINLILISGERFCGEGGAHMSVALNDTVTFNCGTQADTGTVTSIRLVPEPATLALLSFGFSGLALTRRRQQK